MEATLVPLNFDFTAYHVLLPLNGKEYSFSVHNVPKPEEAGHVPLSHVKLECKQELRMLLTGVEQVVQERLNQSMDLTTFVLELKDVLERIVQTRPVLMLPTPAFYNHLCTNLDSVGWEHISWLSGDLTVVQLRIFDTAGREHIVKVDVPPGFPEVKPTASADLPISVDLGHLQGSTLKDIFSQYQLAVERYQDFWEVMEDIDKNVWIVEPAHPSRADTFRRIALGGHCSISIVVDPLSPQSLPECRFFGSEEVISPLRKKLNNGLGRWQHDRLLVANLEDVLEMTFPSQDNAKEDLSADCGICYAYRVSDGTIPVEKVGKQGNVPDRVCENANCARPYHSSCLTEWLRSITTTRQSFDVLFGQCPYCSHPIAVKCAPG